MSYNPSNINGQATMANSSPVVIASNQSAVPVTLQAGNTGGAVVFHLISAAGNNVTPIATGPLKLMGWYLFNNATAPRKLAFHNTFSPTVGVNVYIAVVLPPLSGANVAFPTGIDFTSGLSISTTAGIPDNDTSVIVANDLVINLFYK